MNAPPIELEEAQARLLALVQPMPVEHIDTEGALGRYLARPLVARRTQPPCDLSAMDGYAVRAADMAGPWRVVGESAAGHPYTGVAFTGVDSRDEAVRIATGAVMPQGADCVILQEDVIREGTQLRLTGDPPVPPHRHIRRAGRDFAESAELLPAGTRVGPAQMALAIAGGHSHLAVRRPPHVVVIDSGDELAEDCEACAPDQVPASNGAMLAAMAASQPCVVRRIGPVRDSMEALAGAFAAAGDAEVIVTSGGASVGDHDLVRPALEAWGARIDFWRIAIKPGKPLLVATKGRQIVLGLPGNPVSSHVTAWLFLLPLLRALGGAAEPLPRPLTMRLANRLDAAGGRREFLRARWDGDQVTALSLQDSGALSSLAAANALIDRPAGAPAADMGDIVRMFLLQNDGIA